MVIFAIVIFVSAVIVAWEAHKAPEGWVCHYCHGEVIGEKVCPWCGTDKKEE